MSRRAPRPPRGQGSRLRRAGAPLLIAVLAVVTAALVVAALREPEPPQTFRTPDRAAAVTLDGDTAWRWTGPRDCDAGGPATTVLERRAGSGDWTPTSPLPLQLVDRISVSDGSAVVVGRDPSCRSRLVTTTDDGRTWLPVGIGSPVLDAVQTAAGDVVLTEDGKVRRGSAVSDAAVPCTDGTGTPHLITADEAGGRIWALCQDERTYDRLLLESDDGGASWVQLTDGREETGLDGGAMIAAIDLRAAPNGWLLIDDKDRCPEGRALRVTRDAGATWSESPCLSASVDGLEEVLAAVLRPGAPGYAVVRQGADLVTLTTTTGREWEPAAPGR